ncbi:uncharacterized protein LOC104451476 isoform X1 [Eucalyptus grandis]|uniref:uncharacterized protein LOC104451476 isoform X1 n=1 Tax=Eucalyptus grandis TaxID=71139 RepID=UPI00192E9A72|nr:uncharacterized protein LOC104451476 isoform X1 [Eucalyptus grandis]
MKGKTVVESSSRPDNDEVGLHQPVIASNEDGRPVIASNEDGQPVIANNEDGQRETSFVAMPYLSSNAISIVGASSSDFHPLHEMNVPSQYLPTQNMTTHGDISFWTQPPQSHAVNSNIQPWNLSHTSSGRDLAPQALTHTPPPVNAEEENPMQRFQKMRGQMMHSWIVNQVLVGWSTRICQL